MTTYFDLAGHGAEPIRYEVRASARRRTMSIEVYPDSRVVVRVPARCAAPLVASWVRSRAKWIEQKLERFRRRGPAAPPLRYVNGEVHRYLGYPYPLRLIAGEARGVRLIDEHIVVSSKIHPDPGTVNTLLRAWYFARAAELFPVILKERHAAFFERRGHPLPGLAVKAMRRRWGSMSPRGRMCLNADLIRAPRRCIELVVTHELCHLEQKYHDAPFYRLLAEAMPDWKEWKAVLQAGGIEA
ncbi:MAG TPA: SprT family zinc-dependent metalloprotease [Burkholderiales bacterium]|nr:SprT family zinc-dependent metalloprotease [Burkholderiales bacterium]